MNMDEAGETPIPPQLKEPEIPNNQEVPPAGMTKEAWEKMNLTWGMLESLLEPPSGRVKEAAAGDKGMEKILSMTEGLLKAGEKMGMQSDKVLSSMQEINADIKLKGPSVPSQSTPPTTPAPSK
jgi:hypothetical protein